jgi:hypothetical protein
MRAQSNQKLPDGGPVGETPSREELLKYIEDLGGEVEIDESRPRNPIVLLMLWNGDISAKSLLRILREIAEVERLNFRGMIIGDDLVQGVAESRAAADRGEGDHQQRQAIRFRNAEIHFLRFVHECRSPIQQGAV